MMRTLLVLLISVLSVGCVDNAILELELEIPARPADAEGPVFAYVQVNSARDSNFMTGWGPQLEGYELMAEPRMEQMSIIASPIDYTFDALVRMRFCGTPFCDGIGDDFAQEVRARVESPFYDGCRTRILWSVPEVVEMTIEEPELFERCTVESDRMGDATTHCRLDGSHFCEPPR